ncbi:MAG: hypothetical protein LBK42_10400 [Propionibacteriaceae bacterium]|nr:hypothetical protein [Propionibacteriaceae bacterium]
MDDPQDGPAVIFDALRDSAPARQTLAGDIEAKMFQTHPWLCGVDIDMEKGGNTRSAEAEEIFRTVADKAHSLGKRVSAALPALTADGSVGSENWVRYKQLGEILDHVSIMSYDFAWGGSAPGPISPRWWLEEIYDWAVTQIDPDKLSMGLPCYGRSWFVHRHPEDGEYRGSSTTYYAALNLIDGTWITSTPDDAHPDGDHDQPHVGWLAYRDPDSGAPFYFTHVYDQAARADRLDGMRAGDWNGHLYAVRYSKASGDPLWTVADNSLTGETAEYVLRPRPVRDRDGNWESPWDGWTLTVETLRRQPDSATILDDNCATPGQMAKLYTAVGEWTQWPTDAWERPAYGQYQTVGGTLDLDQDFDGRALHLLARLQLPRAGSAGVHIGNIRADVSDTGRVRLLNGDTLLGAAWINPPGVSTEPGGEPRAVIALRVRGGHVRVYSSLTEENVPLVLAADVDQGQLAGGVGLWSPGWAWYDHVRLGDGWWYQPREAVRVELGGWSWTLGRIPRVGVQWDDKNRFRPLTDIDEWETRPGTEISQDWDFDHIPDFPIAVGQSKTINVRPLDVDCWLGRILLCDKNGAQIGWYSDAEYLARWRDEAHHRWGLQGVSLWTLGQETLSVWERFQGGGNPVSV